MKAPSPTPPAVEQLQQAVVQEAAPRPVINFRVRLFHSYLIIAVFIFGVLAWFARSFPYFSWDLTITRKLQSLSSPFLKFILDYTSWLGFLPQSVFFLVLILAFLWFSGLRWEAASLSLSFALISAIVGALKFVIGRIRPAVPGIQVVSVISSGSFPSGHVVSYTVLLGFLLFLAFTLLKASPTRSLIIGLCLSTIILVGPSRVYRGEHWPSDVLGAYLLGTLWLAASIWFYRWGKPRFFLHQPVLPATPSG